MIVDIVDKYCTNDNNPIKNLRLKINYKIFFSDADPGCLSRIPDPDFYPSRIPDPGSRIPDRETRISDPGSRIPDPGSRISDPGSRIPDPKTATKERGEKFFLSFLFI